MAITHSVKDFARRSGPWMLGPPVTFAVVLLIAFAVLVVSTTMLPSDLVFPLTSTLLFVLAGLVALVAWSRGRPSEQAPGTDQATPQVTYWDVAGALRSKCGFDVLAKDAIERSDQIEDRYARTGADVGNSP